MKYQIEFTYRPTNGRVMVSRVSTKTLKDADKIIKDRIADHHTPSVTRWRLWELKKEGTANEG